MVGGTFLEPIAVIDLMGGVVVRAKAGERHLYRPLSGSVLVDSADPSTVVEALLRLHPFRHLYMADLDAIQNTGDQLATVMALERRFPDVELWVDGGFATDTKCRRLLDHTRAACVLGSESQVDKALLGDLSGEPRLILSLDRQGERLLDPGGLFDAPGLWPARVISMSLGQVGSHGGPDLPELLRLKAMAPDAAIYAAGGVRDGADLEALAQAGAAGVLLASALHDGRLDRATLAPYA